MAPRKQTPKGGPAQPVAPADGATAPTFHASLQNTARRVWRTLTSAGSASGHKDTGDASRKDGDEASDAAAASASSAVAPPVGNSNNNDDDDSAGGTEGAGAAVGASGSSHCSLTGSSGVSDASSVPPVPVIPIIEHVEALQQAYAQLAEHCAQMTLRTGRVTAGPPSAGVDGPRPPAAAPVAAPRILVTPADPEAPAAARAADAQPAPLPAHGRASGRTPWVHGAEADNSALLLFIASIYDDLHAAELHADQLQDHCNDLEAEFSRAERLSNARRGEIVALQAQLRVKEAELLDYQHREQLASAQLIDMRHKMQKMIDDRTAMLSELEVCCVAARVIARPPRSVATGPRTLARRPDACLGADATPTGGTGCGVGRRGRRNAKRAEHGGGKHGCHGIRCATDARVPAAGGTRRCRCYGAGGPRTADAVETWWIVGSHSDGGIAHATAVGSEEMGRRGG